MLNYNFQQINHLEDVLPHIEGRDEYLVMNKEWYIVVNYAVSFEETFLWDSNDPVGSAIRRECRGLIFNPNGKLISRPYHKFFNVGEKEETQIHKIDLNESHVILEKLDGSMIRPIPTREGFRLATKAGVTEVAMNAEEFIADKSHYGRFINDCLAENLTPIFEWVSRKNRIVIDYPEDNLILTGIRYNEGGLYWKYSIMKTCAEEYGIPFVKAIAGDDTDLQKVVNHIRKWDDGEGVVIRFHSGHMIKIKADDYVLRHKSKDSINQEKNVIATILDDSVDDLLSLLTSEDAERLQNFQHSFWEGVDTVADEMEKLYFTGNTMYPEKKDFAVEFVQKKVSSNYAPIMYAMKSGKTAKESIVSMISKSLSSQTKIDQNRWLFSDKKWN